MLYIREHKCVTCPKFVSTFAKVPLPLNDNVRKRASRIRKRSKSTQPIDFPPPPLKEDLTDATVRGFSADVQVENFIETACAVCGLLTLVSDLLPLSEAKFDSSLLSPIIPVTRRERRAPSDSIEPLSGLVLLSGYDGICKSCSQELSEGKVPTDSLANGLWIGEVPKELQGLSWTEKMLISHIKHNICTVKVHVSGMSKMKANVVSHSLPMPKIYNALPPPCEDLDEVLAFIYIGPNVPTAREFQRTPMLVCRNRVKVALEWLKLNHSDYADLNISYKNLDEYPEDEPPVVVNYTMSMDTNKDSESTAVNDTEEDDGVEGGQCPFVVHGLTGTYLDHLGKVRPHEITARAVEHFKSQGKALGIGQAPQPESIYDNPQLYPQMFLWLFPYGYGGL
ncbi:hypothetical protein L226DRAFT_464609 [Lentinus tigrinus ALCF2SS1-7]|uniref:uncharacterized protein n=1 Tax=Lentinus tigrinus ALCF2SS1-7 TaxID=1328758 RepID=UPI001165FDD6|nr:hypothetical protein L226DRAFT_464609 [Lentinus tigrinus ALCF2SS1-7]